MGDKIVDTTDKDLERKEAIIQQARDRFEFSETEEYENRTEAREDLSMLAGKSHWPSEILKKRTEDDRPALTINKLPSFVDVVMNDSRLNKTAIKVVPYGGGSTQEIANVMAGLIRNIEQVSDADVAYQTALEGAASNGFGSFRISTAFSGEESPWDQEILIDRIRDPFTVYMDPSSEKPDGSDARFAFITKFIPRKEFEVLYPGKNSTSSLDDPRWYGEDSIRIAEYWVKEPIKKRLCLLSDGRTVNQDDWESALPELKSREKVIHLEPSPDNPQVPVEVDGPAPEGSGYPEGVVNKVPEILRSRSVDTHKVVQYIINGEEILEENQWAGKYIPIIPVWGKEVILEGKRYIRGVIRFAKDPQRMYNYFRTAATETVALAPKAPYLIADEQIEGYENEWDQLGVKNLPYLKYKYIQGYPLPKREMVTQTALGEITEANIANDEMKATTSIYDASLGASGNEVSGVAIQSRQYQSNMANFTYHDNLRRAIRFAGKILVDLIPKIYDTDRVIAIIGEDEDQKMVRINQEVEVNGVKKIINDFTMGRYKITVTAGPSFNTQRQEAVQSMLDFVRTAPDQSRFVMDLIAENMDWPGAKKIANRFKKLLPPDIDSEGPPAPAQPTIDEILKRLKSHSIDLGNKKKELDIVEKKRELTGRDEEMVQSGAIGALQAIGIGGGNE